MSPPCLTPRNWRARRRYSSWRIAPFYRTLYFRVIVGIVAGVALGWFYPTAGEAMKPLGDGFIKLIRMMIAPVIFLTVVTGIARIGDMRKLGRVGSRPCSISRW